MPPGPSDVPNAGPAHPASHDPASTPPARRACDAAIVIFGAAVRPGGRPSATLRWRVEAAATFAARFAAPLFIPTGAVGRFGPSEASVMATLLRAQDVPSERILLEETGRDTLSSARAVAALVREYDIRAPVFAASNLYHLPRCLLLLRTFGVPAQAAGPPWVPAGSRILTRLRWWSREVAALPCDAALAVILRLHGRR